MRIGIKMLHAQSGVVESLHRVIEIPIIRAPQNLSAYRVDFARYGVVCEGTISIKIRRQYWQIELAHAFWSESAACSQHAMQTRVGCK